MRFRKGKGKQMKGFMAKCAVFMCLLCLVGTGISPKAVVLQKESDDTVDGLEYYIHDDQQTAAVKIQNKNAAIVIPETVDIRGKFYQVTEIQSTAIVHDTVVMNKKERVARDDKEYFKNGIL